VIQFPACAARELGDDDVAVAEELDVEVDVVDGLVALVQVMCFG
jgi:hypothetical protein